MKTPETLSANLEAALEGFCRTCRELSRSLRAAENEINDMFIKRAIKAAEKAD